MQTQSAAQTVTRNVTRMTTTRRTLVRGHGLSTKPLKTSISVLISAEEWSGPTANLLLFDQRVHQAEDRAGPGRSFLVSVSGSRAALRPAAKQVFNRYQRLFQQRNRYSRTNVFTAILERHRELYGCGRPSRRAQYDHAVDVWQWVLRLDPGASTALQIAALFHDIDNMESTADLYVGPTMDRALDRQDVAAKAELLESWLADLRVPREPVERAAS